MVKRFGIVTFAVLTALLIAAIAIERIVGIGVFTRK
jgi:hypothetical protein